MKVLLFAGHSMMNGGKQIDGTKISEHIVTSRIAYTVDRLCHPFVSYMPTPRGLITPSEYLDWRIGLANSKHYEGVVDLHYNSITDEDVSSVISFYSSNSKGGSILAACLGNSVYEAVRPLVPMRPPIVTDDVGRYSQHSRLAFLAKTRPWACVLELGFFTHPWTANLVKQYISCKTVDGADYGAHVVFGIADGLLDFLRILSSGEHDELV